MLDPNLERFPLPVRAQGARFKLHPGETFFVPPGGWWHTARILNPSVTISINGVNRANGAAFRHDHAARAARRSKVASYALGATLFVGDATRLFEVM